MTEREEQQKIAAAIARLPGGYQTRTSAEQAGVIHVKGGTMKGWARLSLSEAVRRFRLIVPSPEKLPRQEAP